MIKYYGGKTWLPKYLEQILPKDKNIRGFVDLFVGGGSVSDYLSTKYKYGLCNDLDSNLINFYTVVKENREELEKYILNHRQDLEFEEVKNFRYSFDSESNKFIKAYKYYVCVYNGFSGKVYDTPTKSNLEAFKKRNIAKDFDLIEKTLNSCKLSNKDYHELIYKDCLYYCDPPYWKVGKNRNRHNYYGLKGENHKDFDHYDFYNFITQISENNYVIISYEDSEEVRDLYKDWNIIKIDKKSTNINTNTLKGMSKDTPELLIMNY